MHPAVWLVLLPICFSLRCYDYANTDKFQNKLHTWVDCPYDSQFCYKSYLESRDPTGTKTYVENRSCGTPNLCQREGCTGGNRDLACCCTKELCNTASAVIPLALTSAAALFLI